MKNRIWICECFKRPAQDRQIGSRNSTNGSLLCYPTDSDKKRKQRKVGFGRYIDFPSRIPEISVCLWRSMWEKRPQYAPQSRRSFKAILQCPKILKPRLHSKLFSHLVPSIEHFSQCYFFKSEFPLNCKLGNTVSNLLYVTVQIIFHYVTISGSLERKSLSIPEMENISIFFF